MTVLHLWMKEACSGQLIDSPLGRWVGIWGYPLPILFLSIAVWDIRSSQEAILFSETERVKHSLYLTGHRCVCYTGNHGHDQIRLYWSTAEVSHKWTASIAELLSRMQGSDASWLNDNEVPEEVRVALQYVVTTFVFCSCKIILTMRKSKLLTERRKHSSLPLS